MEVLTEESLVGAETAPTAISRTFTPLMRRIGAPHSGFASLTQKQMQNQQTCGLGWKHDPDLVVQHCDRPYRAIGYSYTYRIYIFQCIAGYRAIPPPFWGYRKIMLSGGLRGGLGGVSQLKPALCAIVRYRGVSQLYCRKSRLDMMAH